MAFIEDLLKNETTKGLAIGAAAAMLVPVILPAVAAVGRPLARAAIKTGIVMYEKGREAAAEVGEVIDDLVAEARADLERSHAAEAAAAAEAASEEVREGPGQET